MSSSYFNCSVIIDANGMPCLIKLLLCAVSCFTGDHPSSAKIWTEVQSLFGLKPTDQSSRDKKKRKQYWSDFDIVSGSSAGAGLDAAGVEVKREGEEAKDGKLARLESAVPAGLSDGEQMFFCVIAVI